MIIGDDYFIWQPNPVFVKDPLSKDFFGNVLGGVSKVEQVDVINNLAETLKNTIISDAEGYISFIKPRTDERIAFLAIMGGVMDDIKDYLPEVEPGEETLEFTLGSSVLGTGTLG